MRVPPAIDAALLALGRQSGLSSVVRALEKTVDSAVLTAFGKSSLAQESDIAKALDPLRQCLEFARAGAGGAGDAAEIPLLERLATLLEALLAPPAVARRAPAPAATPRAPQRSNDRSVPGPRPTLTLGRPYRTKEIVSAILTNLAGLYDRRRYLLATATQAWAYLATMVGDAEDAFGPALLLRALAPEEPRTRALLAGMLPELSRILREIS
jgi:hypothetical protein